MTERWQRELKTLRRAEPRADIWARVEEGPHGSLAPIPGRQRLLAGGVAFAVFIAAGVFAWNAFRPAGTVVGDTAGPPGPGDLVVTLGAPTEPSTETDLHLPTAVFRLGDAETNIPTQGMTGWPDIPASMFTLPLYGLDFGVPAGTRLVIQGDATAASARVRNGIPIDSSTQELDLSEGSAILPSDPGQYVIELTSSWAEGTATFTASFEIVPVDEGVMLAFDERDPAQPAASIVVDGRTFEATLGSHSYTFTNGQGNADAAAPAFSDADFIEIDRGATLAVPGPPPALQGWLYPGRELDGGSSFDMAASATAFDLDPGKYVLAVEATWADAQAAFYFPISIIDRQVPTSAEVTHGSHAPVPRSVSEACPKLVGELTADATSNAPGDRLTLSGPISHRFHGSFFLSPTEDYQAWWGMALDDYSDVGVAPSTIAKGDDIKTPLSGPGMLGDYRPNGACGFDINLIVPDVAPGSYDVTVISVDAEGYAAYGTVTIEVGRARAAAR